MAHVARAEVAVLGRLFVGYAQVIEPFADQVEQLRQGRSGVVGHIVDLALVFIRAGCGQQIGLYSIVYEAEIPAGLAIAVNAYVLALNHGGGPFGNHRGVGAVRVLPGAEDVEVTQADGFEAVAAGEDVGVQLVHVLGHRIGRERVADLVFHLGQIRVVAVGGAGGGVGEALDLGVLGGDQHVQEAVDVGTVGGDGVLDGARYGAQGGLVEHVVHPFNRSYASLWIGDVAFQESEALPLFRCDQALHFVQVVAVAGGEVVQADDGLVQLEQGFKEIGADEAGYAGD